MKRTIWIALGLVTVLVVAGIAAWWFLRPDPLPSTLTVDSPPPDSSLNAGATITGRAQGPGQVRVWVDGVNFAVPAVREGPTWQYNYQGGLSGRQTLVFALQDGNQWSSTVTVPYRFANADGSWTAGERATNHMPELMRTIIRPVEEVLRKVVVFISEGFAQAPRVLPDSLSSDLDGNGLPDHVQGSPLRPSAGIPYGWIALVLIAGLVCGAIVLLRKGDAWTAYLARRRTHRRLEAEARTKQQAHQLEVQANLRLRVLQEQAKLRATLIKEQAKLRGSALAVQAEQARAMGSLARTRVEGVLDLHKAQLLAGKPKAAQRRGFWARLRGR